MSTFDLLHPSLQFHIVNSLGWRQLRPFQEEVVGPAVAGEDLLVLAPTAGGKTEAAFFPVVSRMLSEGWHGTSVLYVCPIKALLNNLEPRLSRYCSLLGRRAGVWHGDVTAAARKGRLGSPPDVLLTTPESLEALLVSPATEKRVMLSSARAVIVDELHAFAGDDRGWHLLSVLGRLDGLCGRALQRIGLSATVGNPEAILDWMCADRRTPRRLLKPPSGPPADADVLIDHVGSVDNAAVVLSRLHRGEKRLVFVDSRLRAERLGAALMSAGARTFVTHSSLSKEERHRAEAAFAQATDCVIVATSVLELGLDVGDLDRVVQLDAPSTVGSFLQRMGRTGRRAGTRRNCLFLATRDEGLLQAAALVDLWRAGFVEDVVPPPAPYHVLLQQVLAVTLQNRGSDRAGILGSLRGFLSTAGIEEDEVGSTLQHLLDTDVLWEDAGVLWFGRTGERELGRRHFSELLSVIAGQPLMAVLHGRQELGNVHPVSFSGRRDRPAVLTLGGRPWRVTHVDWARRKAYVEPSEGRGTSRWEGSPVPLSFTLCQAMRRVLESGAEAPLSRRATAQLEELRNGFEFLREPGTYLQQAGDRHTWWTFGGLRVNASLAEELRTRGLEAEASNLSVGVVRAPDVAGVIGTVEAVRCLDQHAAPAPEEKEDTVVKLEGLLTRKHRDGLRRARLTDTASIRIICAQPLRMGD